MAYENVSKRLEQIKDCAVDNDLADEDVNCCFIAYDDEDCALYFTSKEIDGVRALLTGLLSVVQLDNNQSNFIRDLVLNSYLEKVNNDKFVRQATAH